MILVCSANSAEAGFGFFIVWRKRSENVPVLLALSSLLLIFMHDFMQISELSNSGRDLE